MIYFILSIFFSGSLFILFKIFSKINIPIFPVIIVNYCTCTIIGFIVNFQFFSNIKTYSQTWILPVLACGILFIVTFRLMGLATVKNGATAASVASKMSVIIPILITVFLYHEKWNYLQSIGVIFALLSVFLISKTEEKNTISWLLIFVFLGSGAVDTMLKIVKEQLHFLSPKIYTTVLFSGSTICGLIIFFINKKIKITTQIIVSGIILGIANYFSLIALLKALQFYSNNNAVLFALNNIGVMLFCTFVSVLFFKEKLLKTNILGIALAIFAILLLNFHAVYG